tara:strand:- start:11432 stop:11635 length:204 start_codon:yes stop_codon:yes gene_type:complete
VNPNKEARVKVGNLVKWKEEHGQHTRLGMIIREHNDGYIEVLWCGGGMQIFGDDNIYWLLEVVNEGR